MKIDILIKNGRVIDTLNNIDEVKDIGIKGNKIVDISNTEVEAENIIDAKDCIITPGLIDFHAHLFNYVSELGIYPDIAYLPTGVTTAVDAGSAGVANHAMFSREIINKSIVRIKSYLHVCSAGQVTTSFHENPDPQYYNPEKMATTLEKYSDEILGLKIRMGKELVGDMGLDPLVKTIEIAAKLDCPIVVHATNPPSDAGDIAELLRKGDIYAHVYHGKSSTIIEEDGKVKPVIKEARDRGVIFDAANGRNHFSFKVAKAAIEDGFFPDIISTDLTFRTMYKYPVCSLLYIMSKYLNLGVDIKDIIKTTTENPAKAMKMEKEIGDLSSGSIADIAILKIKENKTEFFDFEGTSIIGDKILENQMTIKDGTIVYRSVNI